MLPSAFRLGAPTPTTQESYPLSGDGGRSRGAQGDAQNVPPKIEQRMCSTLLNTD